MQGELPLCELSPSGFTIRLNAHDFKYSRLHALRPRHRNPNGADIYKRSPGTRGRLARAGDSGRCLV